MSDASETSLNSRSSVGSKETQKTKRDYKPKAITAIGKHQLDPMKKQCTVCYVDDFLTSDEADDLLDELKSEFFKSSTNTEESTLELDLDQSIPSDTSLRQRIDFLKTKIQKTTEQVFKLSSQISKVVIRRLPTCKEHIPYESLAGKDDNGPNPHVSILSLGVPRPLSLKKGSRVTHKVALHQGSLCVLSENTSMEYTFSIPRGNSSSNENEQLLLFFIGSPSIKTEEDSDHSSQSYNPRSSCESDIITKDTSESETDSVQGEIEEPSLLANFEIPDVNLITPEDDIHHLTFTSETMELSATEERLADVIEQDHDITAENENKVESNMSVLPFKTSDGTSQLVTELADKSPDPETLERTVIPGDTNASLGTTIANCVKHTPKDEVNKELSRHGYPTTGSIGLKRKRLIEILSQPKQQDCNSIQPAIEETLVVLKSNIQTLTDEFASLRKELNVTKPKKDEQKDRQKDVELHKLKDLWNQNMGAASALKSSIEKNFHDLEIAQVKVDEVDHHVLKLKQDLKNYYNSAFFKELHQRILGRKTPSDWVNQDRETEQQARTPTETPLVPNLVTASSLTEHVAPPASRQVSRRAPGYTMTSSAPLVPLPEIKRQSYAQVANSSQAKRTTASPTTQQTYKTVLITDSILRHIRTKDILGVNHELVQINKRDSSGLLCKDLRRKIKEIRPDFIYIHLGVNDVFQKIPLRKTMENVLDFKSFTDWLFETKILLSLPLLTTDPTVNVRLADLRQALKEISRHFQEPLTSQPHKFKKVWVNANSNFKQDDDAAIDYHGRDGIHLSDRGKNAILGNFRHLIRHITRIIQDKPPKESISKEKSTHYR